MIDWLLSYAGPLPAFLSIGGAVTLYIYSRTILGWPAVPMVGVAIALMIYGVFSLGQLYQRGKCDMASLEAEIATLRVDLSINRAAAEAGAVESDSIRRVTQGLQEKIDAYEREIAGQDDAAQCRASDADRRLQLEIRKGFRGTQPAAGSVGR